MVGLLLRTLTGIIVGGIAGLLALVVAYAIDPALVLDMDRNHAPVTSGFYPDERDGETTFAWTRSEATLTLPGLDRRVPWSCTIRFRGARPDPATLPDVDLAVDRVVVARQRATNEYADMTVTIPTRPRTSGAVVTIVSSSTFEPGPADPRRLGVMVERWTCVPARGDVVMPPAAARRAAAISGAVAGAGLAMVGLPLLAVVAGTVAVAAAQGGPLGWQVAPFAASYLARLPWLIAGGLILAILVVRIGERLQRRKWTASGRGAAAVAGCGGYLLLVALVHPSKLVVDALFQAHRLEWVMTGRYYFTQIMPGGVEFPYAIGLYLSALPFASWTDDRVTLLRVVVILAHALSAGLLYMLITHAWNDRRAGLLAVGFTLLVPLPFIIVGNGNLTNAFAQSMALVAIAAATRLPLVSWRSWHLPALGALVTIALVSHISTFVLLPPLLVLMAATWRLVGGPTHGRPAAWLLATTVLAVLLATASYYGHFGDAYRSALRVRAQAADVSTSAPSTIPTQGERATDVTPSVVTLPMRARAAAGHTVGAVGWPLLLLAVAGAWQTWRERRRDRLSAAIVAWGLLYALLFLAGLTTRVDAQFERYSAEFMGRVDLATYPAIVVLAARGAAFCIAAGWFARLAGIVLVVGALRVGVDAWIGWLR